MRLKHFGFAAMLVLPVLLLPGLAAAQAVVEAPWARATAPMAKAGGAFMTISSPVADQVVSAASPVAEMVELHQTVEQSGVMKMLPVAALDLVPGQKVTLKPGGYHIMLMGLKAPLKQGESFPMTLTFAKSKPVTVQVQIEAPGAAGPMMHMH